MKNKKIIGIIAVIIIIIIVVVIFGIIKMKSNGGETVDKNQTLKIKNSNSDFSVKFESIDQENIKGGMLSGDKTKTYTRVKLTITNNSDSESKMYPWTKVILLDSKNTEISTKTISLSNILLNENIDQNTLLPDTLKANQTVSGYIYFDTDSNDIAKIQIKTIINSEKKGDNVEVTYDDYFINLK